MAEQIEKYLSDFHEKSWQTKKHWATRIEKRAKENPEDFVEYLPMVEPYIDVDGEAVRKKPSKELLAAVGHVAKEYPEEVLPLVPKLKRCFEDSVEDVGYTAVSSGYALGMVAKEYPNVARDNIPLFVEATKIDHDRASNNAMALLGDLADEYTDEIVEHVPRAVEELDAEDERMRSNALLVVARAADEYPDRVHQEVDVDEITEMLDTEEEIERTRENVCWTLLYLGERVTGTVPELRKRVRKTPREGERDSRDGCRPDKKQRQGLDCLDTCQYPK